MQQQMTIEDRFALSRSRMSEEDFWLMVGVLAVTHDRILQDGNDGEVYSYARKLKDEKDAQNEPRE
jgi:hypothetical protein